MSNVRITTDTVLFGNNGLEDPTFKVLLVKRTWAPFANCWALPGGHVDTDEDNSSNPPDENLYGAATRELFEETGVKDVELIQFQTFGKRHRDPRGRYFTVAYVGFVDNVDEITLVPSSETKELQWFDLAELPEMAFDHHEIIIFAAEFLNRVMILSEAEAQNG